MSYSVFVVFGLAWFGGFCIAWGLRGLLDRKIVRKMWRD